MNPAPDVVALVSMRQDPVSGRLVRDPADALAAALALKLDAGAELLATGKMNPSVARDYLAIGARSITLLQPAGCPRPEGAAPAATAFTTAGTGRIGSGPHPHRAADSLHPGHESVVQQADATDSQAAELLATTRLVARLKATSSLILAGARTEEHRGWGLLPYQLAHALSVPLIVDVVQVERDPANAGAWLVQQALPRGARRRFRVSGRAVLIVSPRIGLRVPHAHQAAQQGQIRLVHPDAPPAPSPADDDASPIRWQLQPARRSLRPLTPPQTSTGPQRLAQTLGGVQGSETGTRLQHGDARELAAALLEHLRSRNLVRF